MSLEWRLDEAMRSQRPARVRGWTRRAGAILLLALASCGGDDPTQPGPTDTVGAGGGVLEFEGGQVRIEVPANALTATTTFTVQRAADALPDSGLITPTYEFGPLGVDFADTVLLRLRVDPAALVDLAAAGDLIGGVQIGDEWQGAPDSWFDAATSEIVIPLVGFDEPDTLRVQGSATREDHDLARRRANGTAVLWVGGHGSVFAGLRPLYVSPVGGTDVLTCGTLVQPCFTMRYTMAKMRYGEKVVLLGPGTFTDSASPIVDLPPNARLEGQGGATTLDVTFRVATEPNGAAVRALTMNASTAGAQPAIVVERGRPTFENITSRSTSGVRLAGGEVTLRGLSLREDAAFIDVTGGTRHQFSNCTLRDGAAAIIFQQSTGGTLTGCTIRDNDTGVFVPYFGDVTLSGNTIRGNGIGIAMGHDPNPVLAVPTCTARLNGNTISDNLSAGLRLATTGNVFIGPNTWGNTPPVRWNGPAPWLGAPDIVDVLAPLGGGRWWELPASGPAARIGAGMAWEHDAQRVILFGGLNVQGAVLDDTWSFDPAALQWTRMNNVVPPSARTEHAMTGASASGRCLLFGGRDNAAPFNVFDDLYVFDPVAEEWLALNPAPNPDGRRPGPRYGANLVAIGADTFLLYGGLGPGNGSYAEWWIYDAAADAWTDATNHANLPPFRGYAAAGVGSFGDVWTVGGQDAAGTPVGGLHRYVWGNGSTNTWEGFTIGLTARTHASLQRARVNGSSQLVLFGGITAGFDSDVTDATYLLDPGGLNGSPSITTVNTPAGQGPAARARHAAVSFPSAHGNACLIFGGTTGGANLLSDTWIFAAGGSQ